MDEFTVIKVMNKARIEILKEKNDDYSLNVKIQEYLKDEALFFKISKEKAYKILKETGVKEERLQIVYEKLISTKTFYDLLNKGKIKDNDVLIIKYDIYNQKNLFKNKNNIGGKKWEMNIEENFIMK